KPSRSASASLGWGHRAWGNFSYSVSRSRAGNTRSWYHGFSASRQFGRVSANLNLQRSRYSGKAMYLNLQIPLGKGAVSARASQRAGGPRQTGVSYADTLGRDIGYRVDAAQADH